MKSSKRRSWLTAAKEAKATDAIKALITDAKQAAAKCVAVRKDGAAVDIDGDYTETLARIDANKTGLGVFGLAFYENNADRLKVATVSGVVPSTETVASGKYPVSRPLFFYVKAHGRYRASRNMSSSSFLTK